MSTIITDSKHYTDIANAIRLKTGESANFLPAEMAAAIEAISTGASNAVEFTAPFGRVKGDVDGDGQVTVADQLLLQQYFASNSPMLSDEIVGWCSEVHFDGKISSKDFTKIGQHAGKGYNIFCSCVDAGVNPEYYNNWTFHKIDSLNGYFYHDIEVKGMTANSSAFLLASSHSNLFEGVECMEGVARIKVKIPPIEAVECFLVWETDGTIWEDANGGFKTVDVDIPLGRMKGDIDGDGQITEADHTRLQRHLSGYAEDAITDEVEIWCSDINLKGTPDQLDLLRISKHLGGTMNVLVNVYDAGINPDYYNNWTFVKIDDLNGYFYRDIPIKGMNTNSTAVLLVSNYADCFEGVECLENVARIKASRCPVGNCKGNILWKTFEQSKLTVVASAVL